MLINIGMALAVAFGLWLTWMVARFVLELRVALVDAADASWEVSNPDHAIASKLSAEYCRDQIVISPGRGTRIAAQVSAEQENTPATLADLTV